MARSMAVYGSLPVEELRSRVTVVLEFRLQIISSADSNSRRAGGSDHSAVVELVNPRDG